MLPVPDGRRIRLDVLPPLHHPIPMGMESVELVMAVEEEFGIAISDQDASTAMTAGELRDLIVRALRDQGLQADADQVWLKLKSIVVNQLGVTPHQVAPEADFVRDLGVD